MNETQLKLSADRAKDLDKVVKMLHTAIKHNAKEGHEGYCDPFANYKKV